MLRKILITAAVAACLALPACGRKKAARQDAGQTQSPFVINEPDFELGIVIDSSGSMSDLYKEDGRAYKLILKLMDKYFRDRVGKNDRILITQISGTKLPIVYEGKPTDFRKRFGSGKAFSEYVRSRPDPGGSRVHDSIADTLDHLMRRRKIGVATNVATVIFSDMEDTFPNPERSEQRLVETMTRYCHQGAWMGFLFVRQDLIKKWEDHLREAGYTNLIAYGIEEDVIDSIKFKR